MRETKLHIPMTIATGETIGIVGILAQTALPPHNPQEHEPQPMYTSRSTKASIEPLRHSQHRSSSRHGISNDPSSSRSDNRSLSVEDDPATVQRLRQKDQTFKRRGYPIYPIDKRDTRGLKIAIILHGVLAHKDQIYHKQLVRALPVDSFRFDFRANGETPGTWLMGNLADDVEDLVAVVDYLRTNLEYTVEIIVGHSRGCLDAFAWFAKHCPDALPPSLRVPFFVGLSARFNMSNIHERDPMYLSAFAREGFFRWQARVAGQVKELRVYPEQVEQFAAWPTREIALAFPYNTDVLLIHGTADKSVPASDVTSYANILSGVHRRPGSCSIKLIDHADHLFRGFYPQVVEAIVEWLQERSELTNMGLSAAAIRDRDMLGVARFDPSHFGQGRMAPQMWDNNLASAAGSAGGIQQVQSSPWMDSGARSTTVSSSTMQPQPPAGRGGGGGSGGNGGNGGVGEQQQQQPQPSPLARYLASAAPKPVVHHQHFGPAIPAPADQPPATQLTRSTSSSSLSASNPPSRSNTPSPSSTEQTSPTSPLKIQPETQPKPSSSPVATSKDRSQTQSLASADTSTSSPALILVSSHQTKSRL
ncbi:uncharacterized protein UBRO_04511 [Ustilago bromivora]|uniref:AB hydrolase-1 domain-containing protein n=1 Tax=Ustilago bromivora TaxID=307758 RepID=A0A1K0G4W5_9BASI|nr:uncharacterized protein UBRO_04511 [Ustilago bromivora]SYW80426.1 uncharacterized protein UBRO2_03694 [Ustilago bromivora]